MIEQGFTEEHTSFPANSFRAPLWELVDGKNALLTTNHPRRILQISDKATADHFFELRNPTPVSIEQTWQDMGARKPFKKIPWSSLTKFFGTDDMYTSLPHKLSIHGDGHQDRVTMYSYILGQYANLSSSEMKVLMIASSVHDRARTDDQEAPNHGMDAASNSSSYLKVYEARGMKFSEKERVQIGLLCLYHEKPKKDVPEFQDTRMNLLIHTIQAADAADRYRSPNQAWWPLEHYFDDFFPNSQARDAFLNFAAYVTLSSEKERFAQNHTHPDFFVEEAIKAKAVEVGVVRKKDRLGTRILENIAGLQYRRRITSPWF